MNYPDLELLGIFDPLSVVFFGVDAKSHKLTLASSELVF
jgi:hypothetical protein